MMVVAPSGVSITLTAHVASWNLGQEKMDKLIFMFSSLGLNPNEFVETPFGQLGKLSVARVSSMVDEFIGAMLASSAGEGVNIPSPGKWFNGYLEAIFDQEGIELITKRKKAEMWAAVGSAGGVGGGGMGGMRPIFKSVLSAQNQPPVRGVEVEGSARGPRRRRTKGTRTPAR